MFLSLFTGIGIMTETETKTMIEKGDVAATEIGIERGTEIGIGIIIA